MIRKRSNPVGKRRFHFKSPPLKDPYIQRFKEWSDENKGFYTGFRNWLKENGYGPSALGIYGAATRMAIGYLRKPYWTMDPEVDLERVREHLAGSHRLPSTQADYRKGLLKLAEYLRLRCQHPKPEKELPWDYTIHSLSCNCRRIFKNTSSTASAPGSSSIAGNAAGIRCIVWASLCAGWPNIKS